MLWTFGALELPVVEQYTVLGIGFDFDFDFDFGFGFEFGLQGDSVLSSGSVQLRKPE